MQWNFDGEGEKETNQVHMIGSPLSRTEDIGDRIALVWFGMHLCLRAAIRIDTLMRTCCYQTPAAFL